MSIPLGLRWTIRRDETAEADFRRLSPKTRGDVKKVLRLLERGPNQTASKQLDQYDDLWTYILGRWRIVYRAFPDQRLIVVTRIRRRQVAYDDLLPRRSRPDS